MTRSSLALFGGRPVRNSSWSMWPSFDERQQKAVFDILQSGKTNYWTGTWGRRLERDYADYVGVQWAVALMNGTVALECALRSLAIGPGDEVIVPCRTFIASASAVVAVGATPVLCDVDPLTQNLSAHTADAVWTERTRALVAVHLAGMPVDMDPLLDWCQQKDVLLVEDCAQAHGARYRDRPVGSFGSAACFSFCQDKIISTAGEGGLVVTDRPDVATYVERYKDHGKDPDLVAAAAAANRKTFAYLHTTFGSNLRMTEIQAALGVLQLASLDDSVLKRRQNAAFLAEALDQIPGIQVAPVPDWAYHAYYKFYAFIVEEALAPGWSRDLVVEAIAAEGIPIGSGSCPDIGAEKAFAVIPSATAARPSAQVLGATSLMFQVHPTLDEGTLADVCDAVTKVMVCATRDSVV